MIALLFAAASVPSVEAAGGSADDGSLQWQLRPADAGRYRLTVTYRTWSGWQSESAIVG